MGRHRTTNDPDYWSKRQSYERHRHLRIAKTRATRLGSGNGKYWGGLTKSTYRGVCELCGVPDADCGRLHYHHWDDATPSLGLWLCPNCHRLAEGMDVALADPITLDKYAAIKSAAIRLFNDYRLF